MNRHVNYKSLNSERPTSNSSNMPSSRTATKATMVGCEPTTGGGIVSRFRVKKRDDYGSMKSLSKLEQILCPKEGLSSPQKKGSPSKGTPDVIDKRMLPRRSSSDYCLRNMSHRRREKREQGSTSIDSLAALEQVLCPTEGPSTSRKKMGASRSFESTRRPKPPRKTKSSGEEKDLVPQSMAPRRRVKKIHNSSFESTPNERVLASKMEKLSVKKNSSRSDSRIRISSNQSSPKSLLDDYFSIMEEFPDDYQKRTGGCASVSGW